MRLTRAQTQERTHERLLHAGRAVFLRQGYLAATVEQVAAEAGYTRGAVYKHFGGKEGLWHALVRQQGETLLEGLRQAVAGARTRAELLAVLSPPPDPALARWALVSAEAMAALAGRPEHAARVAEVQARFDAEVATVLAAGCARLGVRPAMPMPVLVTAWGALGGGLAMRRAVDGATDVTAVAAAALGAFLP